MPNPFSEDALIEQPAIRLFMDVLGRPSTNKNHECTNGELRVRRRFVKNLP
jgi:hypothetical protein